MTLGLYSAKYDCGICRELQRSSEWGQRGGVGGGFWLHNCSKLPKQMSSQSTDLLSGSIFQLWTPGLAQSRLMGRRAGCRGAAASPGPRGGLTGDAPPTPEQNAGGSWGEPGSVPGGVLEAPLWRAELPPHLTPSPPPP